jgi:isochorismate synthase
MNTPWPWLEQQTGLPRFGFVRRDGTGLFGTGIAERVDGRSIEEVLERVEKRGGAWFVGGCFDPEAKRAPWWGPFGTASAWRPRHLFALPDRPSGTTDAPAPPPPLPDPPAHGPHPDRAAWERMVEAAGASISRGQIEKVVLARSISEPTATDALSWLNGPRGARDMAFLFEPSPGLAFAGLTPELLFERTGNGVQSEALAGTDTNTTAGRARLLASDKNAREHALVVDAVADSLTPLCLQLEQTALELAPAGNLVHRLVSFRGALRPGVGNADLAAALHPTPAVAGTPAEAALSFLRIHEPFDRGWYAGPIGIVEPGRTTLSVALRCGLWRGDTRIAYAGAGLVAGSRAQAEWDETEAKSLAVRRR